MADEWEPATELIEKDARPATNRGFGESVPNTIDTPDCLTSEGSSGGDEKTD